MKQRRVIAIGTAQSLELQHLHMVVTEAVTGPMAHVKFI